MPDYQTIKRWRFFKRVSTFMLCILSLATAFGAIMAWAYARDATGLSLLWTGFALFCGHEMMYTLRCRKEHRVIRQQILDLEHRIACQEREQGRHIRRA